MTEATTQRDDMQPAGETPAAPGTAEERTVAGNDQGAAPAPAERADPVPTTSASAAWMAGPWAPLLGILAGHVVVAGLLLALLALRAQAAVQRWLADSVVRGFSSDPLLGDLGQSLVGAASRAGLGLGFGRALLGGVLAAGIALAVAVVFEAAGRQALHADGLLEAARSVSQRFLRLHMVAAVALVVAAVLPTVGLVLAGGWLGVFAADGTAALPEATPESKRLVFSAALGAAAVASLGVFCAVAWA